MSAIIDTLWCAPLKGAQGFKEEYIFIDPIVGVKDDRRCAIRRKPGGDLTKWAPKGVYYVCMNTAQMAIEQPVWEGDELDAGYLHGLRDRLGVPGILEIQHAAEDYSLHDTKGAFISFLNLASVRAFSEFMGVEIDPCRFRMNVWLTGLEAFEELTWVDAYPGTRMIEIGTCRFRVDDACERCKAPEASPETGKHDLEIQNALDEMMSSRGYKSPHRGTPCVMGFLAEPLGEGLIRKGDHIRLV